MDQKWPHSMQGIVLLLGLLLNGSFGLDPKETYQSEAGFTLPCTCKGNTCPVDKKCPQGCVDGYMGPMCLFKDAWHILGVKDKSLPDILVDNDYGSPTCLKKPRNTPVVFKFQRAVFVTFVLLERVENQMNRSLPKMSLKTSAGAMTETSPKFSVNDKSFILHVEPTLVTEVHLTSLPVGTCSVRISHGIRMYPEVNILISKDKVNSMEGARHTSLNDVAVMPPPRSLLSVAFQHTGLIHSVMNPNSNISSIFSYQVPDGTKTKGIPSTLNESYAVVRDLETFVIDKEVSNLFLEPAFTNADCIEDGSCEVEFYVEPRCKDQLRYGQACENRCPLFCKDGKCDPVFGHCLKGCERKALGAQCDKRCPSGCKSKSCDQYSCLGPCEGHFIGDFCETVCPWGVYGPKCDKDCRNNGCYNCDLDTGKCPKSKEKDVSFFPTWVLVTILVIIVCWIAIFCVYCVLKFKKALKEAKAEG